MNKTFWIAGLCVFAVLPAWTQRRLTDEQWRADIEFVRKELPNRHPAWYTGKPAGAFDAALNNLLVRLPKLNDIQTALELQAVIAAGGDSQTKLDLAPALQRERVIPVGFGWYAEGLFLSGGVRAFESAMGKRILTINDKTPEEAMELVGRFSAVENEYTLPRDVITWMRFPAVFRYVGLSKDDTLRLELDNPGGLPLTASIYPLDIKNQGHQMTPVTKQSANRDLRWQPTQSLYEIFWLPERQTVYFQMNRSFSREMAWSRGDSALAQQLPLFQYYADTLLGLLKANPDAKLLIDLRFNTEGYADNAIELLNELKKLPVGREKKRLFVATNAYTQGGALETAMHYRQNSRAVIVGEPSGQRPTFTYEQKSLTLPNARLPIIIASKQFRQVKEKGSTLQPDILIPLRFEDFTNGKDPVLDFVRAI